jgi:hypothetical protein
MIKDVIIPGRMICFPREIAGKATGPKVNVFTLFGVVAAVLAKTNQSSPLKMQRTIVFRA